jgi:hypothetical protein
MMAFFEGSLALARIVIYELNVLNDSLFFFEVKYVGLDSLMSSRVLWPILILKLLDRSVWLSINQDYSLTN